MEQHSGRNKDRLGSIQDDNGEVHVYGSLKDDAYNEQTNYMRERTTDGFDYKAVVAAIADDESILEVFIKDMNALKRHCGGGVNFKDWWNEGGLSDTELRRIVTTRVPLEWQQRLRLQDIGHKYRDEGEISSIIDFFTLLETNEQLRNRRGSARMTPRGRTMPARGGNQGFRNRQQRGPLRQGYNQSNRNRPAGPNRYQNNHSQGYGNRQAQPSRYQPPRYQGSYNTGGRTGNSTRGNAVGGRFGGQRNDRRPFQGQNNWRPRPGGNFGNSGGRNQPPRRTEGYYASRRRNEAFYHEPMVETVEEEDEEWEQAEDEQYHIREEQDQAYHQDEAEEQLVDQWNDQFYVYDEDDDGQDQEEQGYQLMDDDNNYDCGYGYQGYGREHF
ncbi:hypothetical protein SEMRO_915_G219640.1 [Seminavis robusta]|uniref:Uncharacterized protein n=1 Tax=Seminavis robusta TaxID=568900 RepID=A0A9N8EBR8_9STRA|nr:hypothetical protein SEMRO_915_G219640.1 [Seminavis robusta]|eukprot:Sro915_g219640.1 n/a (385) ;mRNA; r:3442-4596